MTDSPTDPSRTIGGTAASPYLYRAALQGPWGWVECRGGMTGGRCSTSNNSWSQIFLDLGCPRAVEKAAGA